MVLIWQETKAKLVESDEKMSELKKDGLAALEQIRSMFIVFQVNQVVFTNSLSL